MHPWISLTVLICGIVHTELSTAHPVITYSNVTGSRTRVKAVLSENFPDPSVIQVDGVWFAFATSGNGRNIQIAASSDFVNHKWKLLKDLDVLPDPGPWAVNDGNIWAPDLVELVSLLCRRSIFKTHRHQDDGSFVMYYAGPHVNNTSRHCIGTASSKSILGPFAASREPFACPLYEGGAIDPAGFIDPRTGNMYVVYKVDGNSLNTGGGPCNGPGLDGYYPTPIRLQQVSKHDGITHIGEAIQLLDRGPNDGPLVEAPSIFYSEKYGLYFMTFSSNCYSTDLYDIGFAWSTELETEFNKSTHPLMTTSMGMVTGPGGADMTLDGRFALFHGTVGHDGSQPIRYMYAAEADVTGFDMVVAAIL
ncbi:hypothetical protein H2198_007866 [Neophaeococcomyces mojaviensis]|uniref:Uncharacterized protein n=1 Tax=Neophaeococcomyces mojaviensis TaxID=3383035 RepID=A0ACC2ZZ68_9EURO|nr:hypothetical protein H2198_007866 [Knufia sp. JES_112]